jgi:hypothetical protein
MRIFFVLILVLIAYCIGFCTEVKNADGPLQGLWDFKLDRQWTVNEAGTDAFTIIDDYKCSKEGVLYVMDRKMYKIFLFDKKGKFLSAFGKRGEGPGEFSNLRSLYLIGEYLIVVDDRNIHYFTPGGKYIKSVLNNHVEISPVSFINPDKFISKTSYAEFNNTTGKGMVAINDLKKKEQIKLFEFPIWKKGTVTVQRVEGDVTHTTNFSYSVSNLTPQMILYHHKNRIYFGINNEYKITVSGLDGKKLFHFTLERERKKVTAEYKDKIVSEFSFPNEVKKKIRKMLPDYLNYFEKIYVDKKGYIYVFATGEDKGNVKRIDIFSDKGKYLYTSKVEVEDEYTIKNIYLIGKIMYMNILRGEDVLIAKYQIEIPK